MWGHIAHQRGVIKILDGGYSVFWPFELYY